MRTRSRRSKGLTYRFASWSDGGAQTHNISAPATNTTYTATYVQDDGVRTESLSSTADVKIDESSSSKNYAKTNLTADGDEPAGSGKDVYSLIKWDLSTIPAGSKIGSVSVTLNVINPSVDTYKAYALKQPWVESAATWLLYAANKPWEIAGAKGSLDRAAEVAGTVTLPAKGNQTFTLSATLVQGWVDNPATNQGIIIADANNTDGLDFSSRESASGGALAPKLNVTYTAP